MIISDLELHLVSDGVAHVDAGGPFGLVPRVLYDRYFEPDESNLVPQALTCLLIKSEGKTILVDTGLGDKLTPKEGRQWGIDRSAGDLLEGLSRIGVHPEQVDIVLNTHLHWDHCGGNTTQGGQGPVARFPNAVYYVQHLEWQQASQPDQRTRGTYFAENFQPLLRDGRLKLVTGDTRITRHVQCIVTPGHTRGHQSIMLRVDGWQALYVADMAGYAVHMLKTAWLTAYDVLPLLNIRTKTRWTKWALESRAWLIFEHEPFTPVVRLEGALGDLSLQPPEGAEELTAALPILPPPPG